MKQHTIAIIVDRLHEGEQICQNFVIWVILFKKSQFIRIKKDKKQNPTPLLEVHDAA